MITSTAPRPEALKISNFTIGNGEFKSIMNLCASLIGKRIRFEKHYSIKSALKNSEILGP